MSKQLPCLVGRLLSPYVRRVAVTLNHYEMPFERLVLSAIDDEVERERINPVGRVPALVLSDTETLVDSYAILDHLDESADTKPLMPASGALRRTALKQIAIATGAIDRAMTANAERRRTPPDDLRLTRLLRQCAKGFGALEALLEPESYFGGDSIGQADITAVVGLTFVEHIFPGTLLRSEMPKLFALADRAERLPEFSSAQID